MNNGNGKNKYSLAKRRWMDIAENLLVVLLVFYPLRHITWGLDFWDTGYNYANFQYMGTEHMDSMWLFSTYLANAAGNLLMKLPNAGTLMGMNLYTGLFVSILALMGYFFCTKKLQMPKALVFVGEFMAISLCWCPTALLYNYLTYVFFLGACILLYIGLTKESRGCLIGAGALLGANVLVRFSNLPQMAMILAVWAYDFILWLEGRGGFRAARRRREAMRASLTDDTKELKPLAAGNLDKLNTGTIKLGHTRPGRQDGRAAETGVQGKAGGQKGVQKGASEGFWHRLLWHTLWCLAGYLAALAALFGYIHIRYGMGEYIAGIGRLFAMTETASDYKATAMVREIVVTYVENLYWIARIGAIAAGGLVMSAAAGWLEALCGKWECLHTGEKNITCSGGRADKPRLVRVVRGIRLFIHMGARLLWAAVCAAMLVWLYRRECYSFYFYSYDPILRPGIWFLMLTMFVALIRIFHRESPKEEKLLSGMLILIILLTSLGSNNGVFPSLNNLFIAAPYTLWESWRFLRQVGDKEIKGGLKLYSFPLKGILAAFLALCLFQFGMFGAEFVFAEATGVQDVTAFVDNNEVLRNIRMNPQRAQWMQGLSAYVDENGLWGKEVILYGKIPAMSYYLQMPSAFNPWSDLESYSLAAMEKDMAELEERMAKGNAEKPIVLVENIYALYWEGGLDALAEAGILGESGLVVAEDPKWQLITDFMEKYGYEQVFRNGKFALYR